MSTSQRLSQTQIRDGFRLVGEVCDLGDDPLVWRTHLIGRLCAMVGASHGICDEEAVTPDRATSGILAMVVNGYDHWTFKILATYIELGGFHVHPLFAFILPVADRPWTRTRREMIDDGRWYGHFVVNDFLQPSDLDDCIHARQPIPRPGWSNMCMLMRPWGASRFSTRERKLVDLVHEELGRLWNRPAPPDPADDLPPRLRRVVERLRAGDSEKQAALRLGLSRQTVHGYAKELHRRVGVSNRFDLLARLAPSRSARRVRMGFEVGPRAN